MILFTAPSRRMSYVTCLMTSSCQCLINISNLLRLQANSPSSLFGSSGVSLMAAPAPQASWPHPSSMPPKALGLWPSLFPDSVPRSPSQHHGPSSVLPWQRLNCDLLSLTWFPHQTCSHHLVSPPSRPHTAARHFKMPTLAFSFESQNTWNSLAWQTRPGSPSRTLCSASLLLPLQPSRNTKVPWHHPDPHACACTHTHVPLSACTFLLRLLLLPSPHCSWITLIQNESSTQTPPPSRSFP